MRPPAWLRYVLVVVVVLAAITLFLLATAAANTARFGEHYPLLLALNGAVAIALVLLVAYQLFGLRRRLRLRVFGSKLTLRLVLMFAMIGIVPGALIYGVSVQFLGKSIESWFEVRIDKALDAGLTLARSTLDTALKDLTAKGESVAAALSLRPPSEHLAVLNAVREQAGVQEASLYTERGRLLAYSGTERAGISPEPPSAAAMRELRQHKTYATIEAIPERGLYLRVMVPVNVVSLTDEARGVQLMQPVPDVLARDAEADSERLHRIPGAPPLPTRSEASLRHHAHARAVARTPVRACGVVSAFGTAVRAVERSGRGDACRCAGRLQPARGGSGSRRDWNVDALVQQHDAAACGCARTGRT